MMGREGIAPSSLCKILETQSQYGRKSILRILDQTAFTALASNFPPSIAVYDRVSAAVAGNSHRIAVDGNALMIHRTQWSHPQVAICLDGQYWSPEPVKNSHLLIVENLQNFLCSRETLKIATHLCSLQAHEESILLMYGAGNAAAKACNRHYFQQFDSISCLFDLDRGGIQTYSTLKNLLRPFDKSPDFLYPSDVSERLQRSRWRLNDEERRYIQAAKTANPEIASLLDQMYRSQKKLEQETYLEI